GTPTTAGATAVTITATNAAGSGSATLTVAIATVAGGPAISSPLVASVLQGSPFTYTITTINPTNPTIYSASGLPAGSPVLTVNSATGVITGTPTVAGVFNVTLQVQTLVGQAQAILVLTVIQQAPKITSVLAVTTPVGVPFTYTITVTGAPTITL